MSWRRGSPTGVVALLVSDLLARDRFMSGVTRIDLPRLRSLLDVGAQLVEVLPAAEYAGQHLPRAVNIPLKTLGAGTTAVLDRTRAVVVYCSDAL